MANKYRDEIRPKIWGAPCKGIYHEGWLQFSRLSWESLDETYQAHRRAYSRIMERVGLESRNELEASSARLVEMNRIHPSSLHLQIPARVIYSFAIVVMRVVTREFHTR